MDMPKGWKRLRSDFDADPDYESEILKALGLMKEMAEALGIEEMAYLASDMKRNPVSPVLKKLKKWK